MYTRGVNLGMWERGGMGGGWFYVGHYSAKKMFQNLINFIFYNQDCLRNGRTHSKNG
jgi:hypothetical protein